MSSSPPNSPPERRREERLAGGGFPLLSPAEATIVDCAASGLGIETNSHLAVGSLTSVNLFVPAGELELFGRVRWARMVGSRRLGAGEAQPVFRVGLSFVEGQSLDAWDRLRSRLLSPRAGRTKRAAPQRKVVRWRPPGLF